MKALIYVMTLAVLLSGCSKKDKAPASLASGGVFTGEVMEVIDVDSYTYMKVKESDGEKWVAAPSVEVEEGAHIYYLNPMEMKNFTSKTLNRTFDSVYFINKAYFDEKELANDKAATPTAGHGKQMSSGSSKTTDKVAGISVAKADGGYSIAEIYENSVKLKDQSILVRGKVVKFSPNIMQRNWVHVQDGTDFDGKYDLTITTDETLNVGDEVLFEGTLKTDEDFGYGYYYPVLLEKAVKK